MKELLKTKGFMLFLIAGFLNAFVDLGHKIIIQNTIFKAFNGSEQIILTSLINALMLIPFILLFYPSGYVADKYKKESVMKKMALVAIGLTSGITITYIMGYFWLSLAMTILLAAQATYYSPAKYGYIKTLFSNEKLAGANGLVQAISIIAILAGTVFFTVLFENSVQSTVMSKENMLNGQVMSGVIMIACSVLEYVFLCLLPKSEAPAQVERFNVKSIFSIQEWKNQTKPVFANNVVFLSVLGLTIFWSIGQVLLAVFPEYVKQVSNITNTIILQGILGCTGVGITIGSIMVSKASRNHVAIGFIPLGALLVAVGLALIPFLETPLLYALDFVLIGIGGGCFIVPLNALIQYNADKNEIGKVIAANNLFQNIGMLFFLFLTMGLSVIGSGSNVLLTIITALAVFGFIFTLIKMPYTSSSFLLSVALRNHYKLRVSGINNIPESNGVLLLGNHTSFIDWAVIYMSCPRPVRFVMQKEIYEKKTLNWLFKLFNVIPVSSKSAKGTMEKIAAALDDGEVVCLFPEGAITRNAHLGIFKKGFEVIAKKTQSDYKIVPFYLKGLWGSVYSKASEKTKKTRTNGFFRDVSINFGQPIDKLSTAATLKQMVVKLSNESWDQYVDSLPSITSAWINTVQKTSVFKKTIIDDSGSSVSQLSQKQAFAIASEISTIFAKDSEKFVYLLVPTTNIGMLMNMAALLAGKTIINLNYTASESVLSQICDGKVIYTVSAFASKLSRKNAPICKFVDENSFFIDWHLNNKKTKRNIALKMLLISALPEFMVNKLFNKSLDADQVATVLYSSGSEGAPKGVELTHKNILTNIKQISDVLNTNKEDIVLSCLPLFHAFGITVNQFMPLVENIPVVSTPDPTDALAVAKAVAKNRATILCGTSTFFRLYTKNSKIEPLMFESLRIVVAGAEKLNPVVRDEFLTKFNKGILEGYGATETTPVASVNLPDFFDHHYFEKHTGQKAGSVGMPLPGTFVTIRDPVSFEELPYNEDGMIMIGGSQVMKGYLDNPEKTASAIKEIDGVRWYVTGDKGHIDEDGFLYIVDRYSRFAKIGGEMISLGMLEIASGEVLATETDLDYAISNIPDEKKGERIILAVTKEIDFDCYKRKLQEKGLTALQIPSEIKIITEIPKLGTGKTNYNELKKQIME